MKITAYTNYITVNMWRDKVKVLHFSKRDYNCHDDHKWKFDGQFYFLGEIRIQGEER